MVGCEWNWDESLTPEEKRTLHERNERDVSEHLEKNYPNLPKP